MFLHTRTSSWHWFFSCTHVKQRRTTSEGARKRVHRQCKRSNGKSQMLTAQPDCITSSWASWPCMAAADAITTGAQRPGADRSCDGVPRMQPQGYVDQCHLTFCADLLVRVPSLTQPQLPRSKFRAMAQNGTHRSTCFAIMENRTCC